MYKNEFRSRYNTSDLFLDDYDYSNCFVLPKGDGKVLSMPPQEGGEESVKEGKGLKILTPNKLSTRLSTLLAPIKVVHNSNKLKTKSDIYIFCIRIIKSPNKFTTI